HSLFSGKDRDLKIQRQRVLYRGLTLICGKILLIAGNCGRREKQETEATLLLIVSYCRNCFLLDETLVSSS
ncbi:hypothetical protein ABH011_16250, partial [Bacteroides thetaiotaomicron]